MRATWITSAVAGGVFSLAVTLADRDDVWRRSAYASAALVLLFFVSAFFGVVGLPQFREIRAKRRTRGSWMQHQLEDAPSFLVPVWGRMAAWFVAAAGAAIILKVFS